MSHTVKISIITAALDALPDLIKTAASLETQEFDDFEHIVIDGSSTDGTREWLAASKGIRWVSEPDHGIADALNKGLEMARGEWILVLQAGDTLANRRSLLDATPSLSTDADIVSFDVEVVSGGDSRRVVSRGFSPRLNFKPLPHQGVFTRSELFETVGFFDPSLEICMDYDFFLRAYRAGATAITPGQALSRMPDTGVSSRRDWMSLKKRLQEERTVHMRYAANPGWKWIYFLYWPPYFAYRLMRSFFEKRGQLARVF